MSQLDLYFLGPFHASLDGQPITLRHSTRIQALLAYLVLEADHPHRRERVAAHLWPDEPEVAANQNLRQSLFQLRQLLGESYENTPSAETFLLVTRTTVQFNPASDYRLDVTRFLAHLVQGQRKEALELYKGELLTGL